jgi:FKBP-type peptidyl-prolyl cis-trans isomerase
MKGEHMKKTMMLVLTAMLVLFAMPSFAQEKEKGASAQAYEHADDKAIFNRVGDWFATVGKSDEEKATIKAQRQAERQAKKAEKEAKKAAQEAETKVKEQKEKLKEVMK